MTSRHLVLYERLYSVTGCGSQSGNSSSRCNARGFLGPQHHQPTAGLLNIYSVSDKLDDITTRNHKQRFEEN